MIGQLMGQLIDWLTDASDGFVLSVRTGYFLVGLMAVGIFSLGSVLTWFAAKEWYTAQLDERERDRYDDSWASEQARAMARAADLPVIGQGKEVQR